MVYWYYVKVKQSRGSLQGQWDYEEDFTFIYHMTPFIILAPCDKVHISFSMAIYIYFFPDCCKILLLHHCGPKSVATVHIKSQQSISHLYI